MYKVAVLTVSDKGYEGKREDLSGKKIIEIIENNGYKLEKYDIVADEKDQIKEKLIEYSNANIELILTTGGTGFSKRDVTPEATLEVADRLALGISDAIRNYSMTITKRAMLSRAVSVIRKNSLIVNLPGSPKAVEEGLVYILDVMDHALAILEGDASECARK